MVLVARHGESILADDSLHAEGLIGGGGGHAGKHFRDGVCPRILQSRGHVGVAGGNGGDEEVLVEGHIGFLANILFVVLAEPVGEIAGDLLHSFPHLVAGDSRAAAARIIGMGEEEPLVGGSAEQGGLAQAGVTADHSAGHIQTGLFFGVVQHSLCRPRPQGDLTGVGGVPLAVGVEDTREAIGKVAVIARHVAIAKGQHRKAVIRDLLGGHVAVGDVGAEVDVDEEGVGAVTAGDDRDEGKGEVLPSQGDGQLHPLGGHFSRAK